VNLRKTLDAWPVLRQLRGPDRLGLGEAAEPEAVLTREQILSEVASGALTPAEAQDLISRLK